MLFLFVLVLDMHRESMAAAQKITLEWGALEGHGNMADQQTAS